MLILPKRQARFMELIIKVKGKAELNSSYTLSYTKKDEATDINEMRQLNC